MTLENRDQLAHGLGQLMLETSYPVRNTTSGFDILRPQRFDALNEAAAAAAERAEHRGSDIVVWVDAEDGTSRQAHVVQAQNSDSGAQYFTIRALLHPTTRAIRLMSQDRLIEKLERPQVPPTVEALVLSDRPPLIAVRVQGLSSRPMRLELREDLKGEPTAMAYSNDLLYLNGPGAYPCWLVIPDAQGVEGDQGAALRLTLLDVFHLWRFYYPR